MPERTNAAESEASAPTNNLPHLCLPQDGVERRPSCQESAGQHVADAPALLGTGVQQPHQQLVCRVVSAALDVFIQQAPDGLVVSLLPGLVGLVFAGVYVRV